MVYSVLTEPVIPILWLDGSNGAVGIREAFLRAHEIKDIQGDTPLERYAVLRLLIAFAMDMLHPKNSFERCDLLEQGFFDETVFDEYVSACEKDGPKFDLFDTDHPFLQSKFIKELDEKAEKPVAAIVHSLPSGNNHVFIDHRIANTHTITFARAFRALCASYLFCVSGTAGPSSVNNTPPLYAIIVGKNLFETIISNMLSIAESMPLPYGCENVPWRIFPVVQPKELVADVTLLQGLTWTPRRITLIPDADGTIRRVYCQAGLNFQGNERWFDPFVPKFKKKDGSFGTIKPELGRAMWRDVGTLLYDQNGSTVQQPKVLACLSNLYDEEDFPTFVTVRTAGLITNQAAYTGWSEDELSLPSILICDQEKADIFRTDVSMIETTQSLLLSNVQKYIDKPRCSSTSKEHETADQCQHLFLQGAHDILFGTAMQEICGGIEKKEHAEHFCNELRNLIRDVISQVLRASGSDAKSIMQQIEAEKWIWISFKKICEERMKYYVGP